MNRRKSDHQYTGGKPARHPYAWVLERERRERRRRIVRVAIGGVFLAAVGGIIAADAYFTAVN